MRVLIFSILLTFAVFLLSACPGPEDTNGTAPSGGGGVAPPPIPPPPAYLTSNLASMGDVKLGMSSDAVSALYTEDGDYEMQDSVEHEGRTVMMVAVGDSGMHLYGFLEEGLVMYGEAGMYDEEAYNSKVEEFTDAYGDSSTEPPAFLDNYGAWSGEGLPEDERGMKEGLSENVLFWSDENGEVVVFLDSNEAVNSFELTLFAASGIDALQVDIAEATAEPAEEEVPAEDAVEEEQADEGGEDEAVDEDHEDEEAHEDDGDGSEHPTEHPS